MALWTLRLRFHMTRKHSHWGFVVTDVELLSQLLLCVMPWHHSYLDTWEEHFIPAMMVNPLPLWTPCWMLNQEMVIWPFETVWGLYQLPTMRFFGLITTVLLQLELPNLMLRCWSLSVLTYMNFKPRSTWIVVESTQKNYGHDCDHVLCMCAGKHWIKSMLLTATLFPFTCFGIGFALNTVAIFYHSLAAIPFGTMVSLPSHAPCIEDSLSLSVGRRALPLHHSFNTILQT